MDIYQGFITAFGFNYPPRDWVWCAGQLISISDNAAMYSLLGSYYGGDDRTVFGMPELRGRSPIGFGQSPGQPAYIMGQRVGATSNVLSVDQMPEHTHVATAIGGGAQIQGGVYVSPEDGENIICEAGDYLGASIKTRSDKNLNYVAPANKGAVVPLGGVALDITTQDPQVVNDTAGQGHAFSVMQPVIAVNFSIALQGLYPPRN